MVGGNVSIFFKFNKGYKYFILQIFLLKKFIYDIKFYFPILSMQLGLDTQHFVINTKDECDLLID